jgi:alkylation response protein AidB-like acyl-CoA dehydrogenase
LEPRDFWPMEPLFPLVVLSPMLGAATALLERTAAGMGQRGIVGWRFGRRSESPVLVEQLGSAAMEIEAAWLHVRGAAALMDETAQERPLSGFEKARIQADCGRAAELLRTAGDRLMDVAGPAAFATSNPLQRFWRDLSLGTRHNALNARLSMELYGRALLGLESTLTLLPDISR